MTDTDRTDVEKLRHACAASGMHDHDGCSCTTAAVLARSLTALEAENKRLRECLNRLNNPDEAMIEAVAKAMWGDDPVFTSTGNQPAKWTWEAIDDSSKTYWRSKARAALSALAAVLSSPPFWQPTHRHRKGGEYRVVRRGRLEWNLEPVVIYESKDGTTWIRPEAEFNDGRFTVLSSPPQEG